MPATVTPSGTSRVTTAFAPMVALSPMVTLPRIVTRSLQPSLPSARRARSPPHLPTQSGHRLAFPNARQDTRAHFPRHPISPEGTTENVPGCQSWGTWTPRKCRLVIIQSQPDPL
jgi:hypothetical protein